MPVYAVDALPYILSMLGHGYFAGGCRCEVSCDTQDCSGYIVAGTRSAGLYIPCISSAGFAVWGRTAGTLISEQEALHTPLAVAIKGPNGGEAGNGPLGHIVWMVGDGVHTYEAMGTRYGIVIGQAQGRGFVRWMKIPGLTYGPKPSAFHPERTMILQQYHYDSTGKAVRIPDHAPDGRPVYPTIGPTADGKALLLKDGASFVGAGKPKFQDDIWPSPLVGAHGPILAVSRLAPQDGSQQIIIIKHNDGYQDTHRLT